MFTILHPFETRESIRRKVDHEGQIALWYWQHVTNLARATVFVVCMSSARVLVYTILNLNFSFFPPKIGTNEYFDSKNFKETKELLFIFKNQITAQHSVFAAKCPCVDFVVRPR